MAGKFNFALVYFVPLMVSLLTLRAQIFYKLHYDLKQTKCDLVLIFDGWILKQPLHRVC